MNPPTKVLILANSADEFERGPDSDVACAALPVTAELVALCRRRVEAAEAAYARDPTLAELFFHDTDGPQVYGDDLLHQCGRQSDEFHDEFVNHGLAVLPAGVQLDSFQPTRVEGRRTAIRPNDPLATSAALSIAWTAASADVGAPIRTEAVTLEYLEQLLASGQPAGCECEAPGYYCSGVPGVLAHLSSGRLAGGAIVERCDVCQRFPTDSAALGELRRRGIV